MYRGKLKGSENKFLILALAQHICVLDAISEMLARVKARNPSTMLQAKQQALTLTAAFSVTFVELDWNPSTMLQAEGRAHRIGQAKQVKSFFLIALETSDIMWKLLQTRQH